MAYLQDETSFKLKSVVLFKLESFFGGSIIYFIASLIIFITQLIYQC